MLTGLGRFDMFPIRKKEKRRKGRGKTSKLTMQGRKGKKKDTD